MQDEDGKNFPALYKLPVVFTEQTTDGLNVVSRLVEKAHEKRTRIRKVPVMSVASSAIKKLEPDYIAQGIITKLQEYLRVLQEMNHKDYSK